MQRYIYFFLFFFFMGTVSAQMNVSVDVTHFTTIIGGSGGSTNGSITISIGDPSYAPFSIETIQGEVGPCVASSYTSSSTSWTVQFNDEACAGTYCFLVTGSAEDAFTGEVTYCHAEVCVEVQVCVERITDKGEPYTSYVTRYCGDDIPKKTPSLVGNDDPAYLVGYVDDKTVPKTTYIDFLADIPNSYGSTITNQIYTTTDQVSQTVLETGRSQYEVSSQNEIDAPDANFIYKYNSDGSIEWVYHTYAKGSTPKKSNVSPKTEANAPSLHLENVFPNPFSNEINVQLYARSQSEIEIHLTDMLGKNIVVHREGIQAGNNQIQLSVPFTIAEGIYLLRVVNKADTTVLMHKLVHHQ